MRYNHYRKHRYTFLYTHYNYWNMRRHNQNTQSIRCNYYCMRLRILCNRYSYQNNLCIRCILQSIRHNFLDMYHHMQRKNQYKNQYIHYMNLRMFPYNLDNRCSHRIHRNKCLSN